MKLLACLLLMALYGCMTPIHPYDPSKDPVNNMVTRQNAEMYRQRNEINNLIGLDRDIIANLPTLQVLQFKEGYKEGKDFITYHQTCEEEKYVPDTISTYTSYDGGGTIDTPPENSFPMTMVTRVLSFHFDKDNKISVIYDSFQHSETFHLATCDHIKD